MSERRRPTRGERGARPDPLNYDLYCRKCASKYYICNDDIDSDDDLSFEDWLAQQPPKHDDAMPEPESTESDDWISGAAVVGAIGAAAAFIVWVISGCSAYRPPDLNTLIRNINPITSVMDAQ